MNPILSVSPNIEDLCASTYFSLYLSVPSYLLNISAILENALEYLDFLCVMLSLYAVLRLLLLYLPLIYPPNMKLYNVFEVSLSFGARSSTDAVVFITLFFFHSSEPTFMLSKYSFIVIPILEPFFCISFTIASLFVLNSFSFLSENSLYASAAFFFISESMSVNSFSCAIVSESNDFFTTNTPGFFSDLSNSPAFEAKEKRSSQSFIISEESTPIYLYEFSIGSIKIS